MLVEDYFCKQENKKIFICVFSLKNLSIDAIHGGKRSLAGICWKEKVEIPF